jgi:hypothetical protein
MEEDIAPRGIITTTLKDRLMVFESMCAHHTIITAPLPAYGAFSLVKNMMAMALELKQVLEYTLQDLVHHPFIA